MRRTKTNRGGAARATAKVAPANAKTEQPVKQVENTEVSAVVSPPGADPEETDQLTPPGAVPEVCGPLGWDTAMVQTAGESSYTTMSDGWEIHMESFVPEAPRAVLLFAHGFAESTHTVGVRRLAHACKTRRIVLETFDAHAHGLSLKKNGVLLPEEHRTMIDDMHLTMPLHVAEVAAVVAQKHKLPLILMGHGIGATSAMLATRSVIQVCKDNKLPFVCAIYVAPAVVEQPTCCSCWYQMMCGTCCTCCWCPRGRLLDEDGYNPNHILGPDRNPSHLNNCFLMSRMMQAPEDGGMMTVDSWGAINHSGEKLSVADVHTKFFLCEDDEVISVALQQQLHAIVAPGSRKIEYEVLRKVKHNCMNADPNSLKVIATIMKYVEAKLLTALASRLVKHHMKKEEKVFGAESNKLGKKGFEWGSSSSISKLTAASKLKAAEAEAAAQAKAAKEATDRANANEAAKFKLAERAAKAEAEPPRREKPALKIQTDSKVIQQQGLNTTEAAAVAQYPEGATDGKDAARNGCSFKRPTECILDEEKEVYNAGVLDSDTMYCHHLNSAGQHIVLNGLPSSDARHCCGVIYTNMGWSGKTYSCKEQTRPKGDGEATGHDACTVTRCPFLAEGRGCPYMPLNTLESIRNSRSTSPAPSPFLPGKIPLV